MCGIYGRWNLSGAPIDVRALERATTLLRHRGPDDEGYLLVGTREGTAASYAGDETDPRLALPHLRDAGTPADLAFGFRRLAIVDLSPLGHQPMRSEDGRFWLVFNGEIYNYRELRDELRRAGHAFRSDCDSEVILAAYAQWGAECLDRFNGMWALAIWDAPRQALFLARDRFGVKPLHYAETADGLLFGSEIKSLVGPHGVPFRPDGRSLYEFLVYDRHPHAQSGRTFCEGVYALPPGWCMTVRREGTERRRFYDLRARAVSGAVASEAARVAQFRELLTDAVRLRMHADVPLGTCLSGGLDSSTIVALVNEQLRAGEPAGAGGTARSRQQTFSAVYHEEGRYNERRHVETMVAATGAQGHYVVPTPERLVAELDDLVWHQDEPFGSTSIFAQWCVMALAREQGTTVLLDGQGADEALAGYLPYGPHVADALRSGGLASAWRELRGAQSVAGVHPARVLLSTLAFVLPAGLRAQVGRLRPRAGHRMLAPEFAGQHADAAVERRSWESLGDLLYDVVEGNLPELLRYEDRNSMAFHIESRVPFVDYRVMEFCFAQAGDLRIRDGWTKYLLRRSMSDLLPESIAWRRDKVGFETPEGAWLPALLAARWPEWSGGLLSAPYVDQAALTDAVAAAMRGQGSDRLLWRLINVELWLRGWAEPAAVAPRGMQAALG